MFNTFDSFTFDVLEINCVINWLTNKMNRSKWHLQNNVKKKKIKNLNLEMMKKGMYENKKQHMEVCDGCWTFWGMVKKKGLVMVVVHMNNGGRHGKHVVGWTWTPNGPHVFTWMWKCTSSGYHNFPRQSCIVYLCYTINDSCYGRLKFLTK